MFFYLMCSWFHPVQEPPKSASTNESISTILKIYRAMMDSAHHYYHQLTWHNCSHWAKSANDWPISWKIGAGIGAVVVAHYLVKKLCCGWGKKKRQLFTKDWQPNKVYLYQFPRSGVIPNLSPYCLKLETWLRYAGIDYESTYSFSLRSKEGTLPAAEINGVQLHDSAIIIQKLSSQFELSDMDSDLSEEELGISRAVEKLCENSILQAVAFNRYVDVDNIYKFLSEPVSRLPRFTGFIARNFCIGRIRKNIMRRLIGHGMGRHDKEDIYDIGSRDIAALSSILGESEFFFGERCHSVDLTVFSVIGQIIYLPLENPLKDLIQEDYPNLAEHCDRVKEKYWEDWDEITSKDGAVPVKVEQYS